MLSFAELLASSKKLNINYQDEEGCVFTGTILVCLDLLATSQNPVFCVQ